MRAISARSINALKNNNKIEAGRLEARRSELLGAISGLEKKTRFLNIQTWKLIKGIVTTIKKQMISFFKHKDAQILLGNKFDVQRVYKIMDVWTSISELIDKNEMVRALLDSNKKDEFVQEVRTAYAAKFAELINGQEVSLEELIEEILNKFV
jgi:hypothetical protein